ncbi:MAG: 23S rRNA pseudouridine2604 synthase [Saprospiraceae bacterium]|jgi:23S rRNA pseudouridine2604 synthase
MEETVRLSKEMASRGLCSRREADRYIEQGWVLVDDEVVDVLGSKVLPSQKITLKNQAQKQQDERKTVILNKPIGYVSNLPEEGYLPATELITPENYVGPKYLSSRISYQGLAPAGRLDIDSQGLLILTQDGRVARQLIGENSTVEKEYLIWVIGDIDNEAIERLRFGLRLDGQPLKSAKVKKIDDHHMSITLTQGRKRQIRRMCDLVDLRVDRLMRIRIGKLRLGKLPPGKWRYLNEDEQF